MYSKLKNWKTWVVLILFLIIIVASYLLGNMKEKTKIADKLVDYDGLIIEIEKLEENINKKESTLKDKEKEVKEAESLLERKQSLEEESQKLTDEIKSKDTRLSKLDKKIEGREEVLEKLQEAVVKKKEEPVELLAGEYIVGADFSEGRYKAVKNGRGSNFVVYSSSGKLKVNTILSRGDYVFFADDGDTVKTSEASKLIPVE